jgi:mono/diheme cytochrome c family protein
MEIPIQIKKAALLLSALGVLALLIDVRAASTQMMGGDMGGMMGGGGTHSMHAMMSWMSGTELKAIPDAPEPKLDADMRSLGAQLYTQHCAICHGPNGDGRGLRATGLLPPPRDFTKGVFAFRSTPSGTLPTDEDLWKVISNGLHGTAMVPWISLSENERWALVAYVETFSPRFATEVRVTPVTLPKPLQATPDLLAQGKQLYLQDCATCHGVEGRGNGSAVIDGSSRQMRPRDITGGVFERGSSMEDIYLTLRTGLNGTPMLSFENALTPPQTWAVAAYVRSLISKRSQASGMMGSMMSGGANQQERKGMMIDMPGMHGMNGMSMSGH